MIYKPIDKNTMSIELQNLDCNCNNCIHMKRNMDKFQQSLADHHRWQLDYFNTCKANMIDKAKEWLGKGEKDKHDFILKEVDRMKFQFDKSTCAINYGFCDKFNKAVSFIPNTLQLDTQQCFINRRQNN